MINKCYDLADPEKSVNTVYHDFDQIYEEQSNIDFKNGIGNKTDNFDNWYMLYVVLDTRLVLDTALLLHV